MVRSHFGTPLGVRTSHGQLDSLDSPRPGLGGSHHLPPYSILCDSPRHPRPNVTFSREMQSIGDLENVCIMFDHFKHRNGWTTMVCHIYELTCCEVLTILFYDMQSKSNETQCVLWTKLNKIMFKHDLSNTNFKGFMANLMCRWIGMMSKLFMGQEIPLSIWLGNNTIAYFIRFYHLIDTPSN